MTIDTQFLKIINPNIETRLGEIRHALFDFDGTLSVLRQGWEDIMIPLMVESICGSQTPPDDIELEVREYVDRSTGILTIEQMRWLEEAVRRHGLVDEPLTAAGYKARYLDRLLVGVDQRVEQVERGDVPIEAKTVPGARAFVQGLADRGITLYLASGTDHPYVVKEASVLDMKDFFTGGVYGALDATEANNKERIIQRILDDNNLSGDQLIVAGDGPVEIREAVSRGAIALGVASDEVTRQGWNSAKIDRLTAAGADLLVPDFSQYQELLDFLFPVSR